MDLPPTHAYSVASTGGKNSLTERNMLVTPEMIQRGRTAALSILNYGVGAAYAQADGSPLPNQINLSGFTQPPQERVLVDAHNHYSWPLMHATFPQMGLSTRIRDVPAWINPYDTAWETSSPALDATPPEQFYWG